MLSDNKDYAWALEMVKTLDSHVNRLCILCNNKDIRQKWTNHIKDPNEIYVSKSYSKKYVKQLSVFINELIQLKYFVEEKISTQKTETDKKAFEDLNTRIDKINELLNLHLKNALAK